MKLEISICLSKPIYFVHFNTPCILPCYFSFFVGLLFSLFSLDDYSITVTFWISSNFLSCRGHSMAMDHVIQKAAGTSQWSNGEGLNFLSVSVVILQFFIIAEMVIYLILFHHIYIHNKNMRNSKSGICICKIPIWFWLEILHPKGQ